MSWAIGKEPITGIVLDSSYYPPGITIPGIEDTNEAYDALNSALAVNFNTINAVRKGSTVYSAEKQTPITPLAVSEFRRRGPQGRSRISLTQEPEVSLKYAGELLAAFIEKAGGKVEGEISVGPVPEGMTPVYVHNQSRSLAAIINQLLIGSNNYIANQIFLTLGAQQAGYPATSSAAREALQQQLAALYGVNYGTDPQILLMEEGSGLSREQRSSGTAMLHILEVFQPFADLLAVEDGVLRKSGTLTGVYNFAGYIPGPDGLYPFVILTNQGANNRSAILRLLRQRL